MKSKRRTSLLSNLTLRKATGIILMFAYIINPYGLLLADDTAGGDLPQDAVIASEDQDSSVPGEDEDAAVPAPGENNDDPDVTDPQDTTDPQDDTDPSEDTLPSQDADAAEPADEEPQQTQAEDTDRDEPAAPSSEPADPADDGSVIEDVVLDSSGKTWKVTATFGPECNIPSDAKLRVKEITSGKDYKDYSDRTADCLDDRTIDYIRLFDISIVKDGVEIEPAEGTSVRITINLAQVSDYGVCVLHFPDNEEAEVFDDVDVSKGEGTEVTFDTSAFSVFAVAGYTLEKVIEAGDGKTYKFILTYDDKAGFPEDASLEVSELKGQEYEDYLEKTLKTVGGDKASYARIFDVSVISSDGTKIQPASDIKVDVILEDAAGTDNLEVVHFGSKPEQIDASRDGKVLSFTTSGFSIYAIVDKTMAAPTGTGWIAVNDYTKADDLIGKEIYISQIQGPFMKNNQYTISGTRTGIERTKHEVAPTPTPAPSIDSIDVEGAISMGAKPFHIEKEGNYFYFWCLDDNGNKKYVRRTGTGTNTNNNADKSLSLVDENEMDERSAFVLGENGSGIYIASPGTTFCWNMQSGYNGNGRAFAAYPGTSDINARFVFWYYVPLPDDPYDLDGSTYGLMNLHSATMGYALMGDGSNNHALYELIIRADNGGRTVYVDENSDISMWTFHNVSSDGYKLSTEVEGSLVYLKLDSGSITVVASEDEATVVKVTPGSGADEGKIFLSSGNQYLTYDTTDGFKTTTTASSRVGLNLVEKSNASLSDKMTYSAKEVSVSDTVNVSNGAKVIVYTRVWNETTSSYDFYAINHDGSLYPCYERGDSIMWVGDVLESIQWEFTEYYWEGTNDPNYYYELYNPYSDKYLAPQLNGQILSSDKIGINLEGRREGEYFTDITAWDNSYYTYAALAAGTDSIESTSFAKAGIFYFAILNPADTTDALHEVATEGNADHGITMKIVDFGSKRWTQNNQMESEVTVDYFNNKSNTKGLLSTDLVNGYPTIVYTGQTQNNPGCASLFSNATTVDHLFLKSVYDQSGYLEYNSCQNFATLLDEQGNVTNSFTVYKELGTTDFDGRNTLKHGQFFPLNNIKPGVFSYNNPQNLYSMHAVLNQQGGELSNDDPRKYERLYTIGKQPNYYLGMELSASFVQTPNGKDEWGHDLIFEFSGDDDFWFYVDGELVLDLGGIHSAESGSVNFATGKVVINNTNTTLREIFIQNRKARNPGMTDAEAEALIDSEGIFVTDDGGATYHFADFSAHKTKIFYMERGAGASNLHIRFNLASVAPGNILLSKQVTGEEAKKLNLSQIKYAYQIYYKMPGEEETLLDNTHGIKVKYQNSVKQAEFVGSYTPSGSSQSYSNVYLIDPRYSAEVDLPDGIEYYRVVECGVNDNVYNPALINGKPATDVNHPDAVHSDYGSGQLTVDEVPSIVFNNEVKPGSVKMARITKELYDNEEGTGTAITREADGTTFSFRLSLSDGSGQDVQLTSRYGYYVADPDGKLCRWDPSAMGFTATSWDADDATIEGLTDNEKDTVLFYTSNYGSVSEIPAGYSIVVPALPIGTVFQIEERDNEIPVGYSRIGYFGDSSTYDEVTGKDNAGIVNTDEAPQMTVKNMRGWGLTVNKEWTDKDYISDYAAIYVALYDENDTLIEGSVHQIKYPETSTYYSLDDDFANITSREVTISNPAPVVGEDGTVSDPGTVMAVVSEGTTLGTTAVDVRTKENVDETITYSVDYEQGTPTGSNNNVREDTITNIRAGALMLDLYKWNSGDPLKDGVFSLKCDGNTVGEYTSDADGKIVVLYGFEENKEYELTQVSAPNGYIGLPSPVRFTVDSSGNISFADSNSDGWRSSEPGANGITGYVNIYNKPFELKLYKHDLNDPDMALEDAHFAVFRQLYSSIAGYSKSATPMTGFEDIATDSAGEIVLSSATGTVLKPGVYYLTETAAPAYHQILNEDVILTVSENGLITVEGPLGVSIDAEDNDDVYNYRISLANENDGSCTLKITKEIAGNFGNRTKRFDLEVLLTDDMDAPLASAAFDVKINGEDTVSVTTDAEGKLTFDIGHDDAIYIMGLPSGTGFTVFEDPDGYISEFIVDDVSKGEVTSVSGSVPADKHVHIVNTYEGVIPTGVSNACGAMAVLITASIAGFAVMIAIIRRKRRYYL